VSSADLVHAHGHQAGLLASLLTGSRRGFRARRGLSPRLVVSQHNAVLAGSGRQVLKRLSQRWVARRADLVTGASSDLVSQALAFGAGCAELAKVPSPRVPGLLAQDPADLAARARIRQALLPTLDAGQSGQVDLSAPLVVTISRIAPQKNLPVLVQAAALLRRQYSWVVLGDGDAHLLAQLRQQASELGAHVYFAGPRDDVGQWLRAAEVFVLPSEWEARALVVQEAMASGTPVVATDVGGLPDLVRGNGLLVPPGDAEAIASATARILADPGLRAGLAAGGRAFAMDLPDGSDTAAWWLGWYSETLRMT
jgi:glycosyltransferase involved in cell wall biosynthesis